MHSKGEASRLQVSSATLKTISGTASWRRAEREKINLKSSSVSASVAAETLGTAIRNTVAVFGGGTPIAAQSFLASLFACCCPKQSAATSTGSEVSGTAESVGEQLQLTISSHSGNIEKTIVESVVPKSGFTTYFIVEIKRSQNRSETCSVTTYHESLQGEMAILTPKNKHAHTICERLLDQQVSGLISELNNSNVFSKAVSPNYV